MATIFVDIEGRVSNGSAISKLQITTAKTNYLAHICFTDTVNISELLLIKLFLVIEDLKFL